MSCGAESRRSHYIKVTLRRNCTIRTTHQITLNNSLYTLTIMAKTSKVIYKPDSQSTEEYTVVVDTEEYKKWKQSDERGTIPLAQVLDSFDVFYSGQGAQGLLGKASNQQLDTVFETHKDVDVCKIILEKGREQGTDGVASSTFTGSNVSRGGDGTRGAGGRS
ncbi:ribosome maturation protein [Mycena maculata]|uniref:Ribosome maturation protein n=1 Tax=Mycena maculata TaxID=230809 RepID=A0AAD7NBH9_9AGAR|nr:ribosome maturation protein [Mycena maculata]